MTDQEIIDSVNADFEPVLILKDGNFSKGRRSNKTFLLGNCFGRLTLPEDNSTFYHSLLHSTVKSYNKEEFDKKLIELDEEYQKHLGAVHLLN